MGDFYKLNFGSHVTGIQGDKDNPRRHYRSNDPANNIVESDQPLDELMPEKFSRHKGLPPRAMGQLHEAYRQPAPPGPPTDYDRAMAQMAKAMSVGDMEKQAKVMQQQLEELQRNIKRAKERQEEQERQLDKMEEEQGSQMTTGRKEKRAEERADRSQGEPSAMAPNMSIEEAVERHANEGTTKSAIPEDTVLHQMNVNQLRQVAGQNNVQLQDNMRRADIIAELSKARAK